MALYRTICLSFWTDAKIVDDFTPEDKYFYLYLFTNPHTNLAGCYGVSIKQIASETGYSVETINKLIDRFAKVHKVAFYNNETKEMLLFNWHKYNWTTSDKFRKPLERELNDIKCPEFKSYLISVFNGNEDKSPLYRYGIENLEYDIHTNCIGTNCTDTSVTVTNTITNTNTNTNTNTDNVIDYQGIVDMFNNTCISLAKVSKLTDERKKKIKTRLSNFDINDLQKAFIKIEESDFLLGKNTKWKANFDWIFKNDENITKILEGVYDNNNNYKKPKSEMTMVEKQIDLEKQTEEFIEYLNQKELGGEFNGIK